MLDIIPLSPPLRLGIIGGGQLGKMMTVAAKQLGLHVTVLDPQEDCPAAQVSDSSMVAAFDDQAAIARLVKAVDVTTYEFEHIDSQVLLDLEKSGHAIYPEPRNLQLIQNKLRQKTALQEAGIPVAEFVPVSHLDDLTRAAHRFGYPFLLKTCAGGYDGKGNYLVQDESQLAQALAHFGQGDLLAEAYVPFSSEISVMVARDRKWNIAVYPLSENEHEDNILRYSLVPARVSHQTARRCQEIARAVMELFRGVGIFCVEMFVTQTGEVLVNEVAPRPHNSGHYTIEACQTSQFEQHVRAITGLPLGDVSLRQAAVMVNLLGEPGPSGPAVLEGCSRALAIPGVHLHFYGKKLSVPKRKMGHITVTAATLEEAFARSQEAAKWLKVKAMAEEVTIDG